MKIYVAGPMRGIPNFNFPAFDAAAARLRNLGHQVCNPAERDRLTHGDAVCDSATGDLEDVKHLGFNLRETLAWDLAWIAEHADAVAVLPGWEDSKGAKAETALALALGLSVAPVEDFTEIGILDRPMNGEVVVTSSTGGQKGSKEARFDLLPPAALDHVARHFGKGAAKYADRNWEKGYDYGLSFAAAQRHLWAWWSGEDMDTDPAFGESPHLAAAGFHILALLHFADDPDRYGQFDNRP